MSDQIQFDLYQRYRFIQHLIAILDPDGAGKILEVGAAGSPLRNLMQERHIVSLDQAVTNQGVDVRASGLHLPFSNRAFGLVLCIDTLEHMEESVRGPFTRELMRVADAAVIVGFPHADRKNAKADQIFLEFVKQHRRKQFQQLEEYLSEHTRYGLPDPLEIRKELANAGGEILEFQNSNIYTWLLFQLGHFTLVQQPQLEPVRTLINDFFNQKLESYSHTPPCYRTIFVATREKLSNEMRTKLLEPAVPDTALIAQEYTARSIEWINAFDTILKEKNANLALVQAEKEELASAVRNLQEYLNLFLQHPAYKVYRLVRSALERLFRIRKPTLADAAYLMFQKTFEPDEEERSRQSQEWKTWTSKPSLSIVTAVFEPDPKIFQQTIDSVLQQTYGNWIWNVVDASKNDATWNQLVSIAAKDPRVKPKRLSENLGISHNFNEALKNSSGDFVVMLDHDDVLAPHALFSVAQAIQRKPDLDFIYSDSDKLDEKGRRCQPLFKPDWSPEMMLSWNLLNQISVFRRSLLEQVGYLDPQLDGAQDWDLYLRISEKTQSIHHIPQILYHWRKTARSTARSMSTKPFARKAQTTAVTNHLLRTGIQRPQVFFSSQSRVHNTYPLSRWKLTKDWKVSIIIPTKDRVEILKKCLESVLQQTTYRNYEIVLVDNGSSDPRTASYYGQIQQEPQIRFVDFREAFNFGKACNTGAANAHGDVFLFLNNDTEVLEREWLELMLQWFERPGVGVVGGKLLYPNRRIQHAGVILGFGGLAGHLYAEERENIFGLFGTDGWYRNLSAVTGACLMIPRELFSRVGGFDETFQLIYSDVDLCIRASELRYRIVYSPEVRLLHHESATHERRIPRVDFVNATKKWRAVLQKGDPYYNSNLTNTCARPAFKMRPDETLIQLNDQLMERLPQKDIILLPGDVL